MIDRFFRQPKPPVLADKTRERAGARLGRLKSAGILDWADQAGTGIAKALDDYRRLGDRESLLEAAEGVSALAGALDALIGKHPA